MRGHLDLLMKNHGLTKTIHAKLEAIGLSTSIKLGTKHDEVRIIPDVSKPDKLWLSISIRRYFASIDFMDSDFQEGSIIHRVIKFYEVFNRDRPEALAEDLLQELLLMAAHVAEICVEMEDDPIYCDYVFWRFLKAEGEEFLDLVRKNHCNVRSLFPSPSVLLALAKMKGLEKQVSQLIRCINASMKLCE